MHLKRGALLIKQWCMWLAGKKKLCKSFCTVVLMYQFCKPLKNIQSLLFSTTQQEKIQSLVHLQRYFIMSQSERKTTRCLEIKRALLQVDGFWPFLELEFHELSMRFGHRHEFLNHETLNERQKLSLNKWRFDTLAKSLRLKVAQVQTMIERPYS